MLTIDAQVHAYERNHPGRPWARSCMVRPRSRATTWWLRWMPSASTARCWCRRSACIATTPATRIQVHAAHPGRFGLIKPVDPTDPGGGRNDRRLGRHHGHRRHPDHAERGLSRPIPPTRASTGCWPPPPRHSLPVNLMCSGRLEQVGQLAARQSRYDAGDRPSRAAAAVRSRRRPPSRSPICQRCWHWRRTTTSWSRSPAPARCRTSRFPYKDIWDPLGRIFDAFGFDRCMWGTDWTRAVALADLRAGSRGVPRHRSTVRQRPGHC